MTTAKGWIAAVFMSTAVAAAAVEFNVGIKKDFISGLKVTNRGLGFEDGYLVSAGAKLKNCDIPVGSKVVFYLSGVSGFVARDGKVAIGASMTLTDKSGKVVMDEKDLFADPKFNGITLEDSKSLSLSLMVGDPMVVGGTYTWALRFWDKGGKGEIKATAEIKVMPRALPSFIKMAPRGVTIEDCALAGPDGDRMEDNAAPAGSKVALVVLGAKGFTVQNGRVFIGASMLVTGPAGEKILDEADLLAKYDTEGIPVEDAKTLSLSLSLGEPVEAGKTYSLKGRWWDKKGKAELPVDVQIRVVPAPE